MYLGTANIDAALLAESPPSEFQKIPFRNHAVFGEPRILCQPLLEPATACRRLRTLCAQARSTAFITLSLAGALDRGVDLVVVCQINDRSSK